MSNLNDWVWSGNGESPETMPMGAPDASANVPTMMWGQHHRISGYPWFRGHRQSHEELMGLGVKEDELPQEMFDPATYTIDWKTIGTFAIAGAIAGYGKAIPIVPVGIIAGIASFVFAKECMYAASIAAVAGHLLATKLRR